MAGNQLLDYPKRLQGDVRDVYQFVWLRSLSESFQYRFADERGSVRIAPPAPKKLAARQAAYDGRRLRSRSVHRIQSGSADGNIVIRVAHLNVWT